MIPSKTILQLLPYVTYTQFLGTDKDVTSIEYDSRSVKNGSIYVARKGTQTDGHHFIHSAITNGASCIVCEYLPIDIEETTPVIVVVNSNQALAELSHAFYDFPTKKLCVIGVTGTNGKTTCTYLLKQIHECLGISIGMIGTTGNYINNELRETRFTTPEAPDLCALFNEMIDCGVKTVCMEVSSHALSLYRVHNVEFSGAIFTNLTQDHLDFHGTMDNYATAKKVLFDKLSTDAIAVVLKDDDYSSFVTKNSKAKIVDVGRDYTAAYCISNEAFFTYSTEFILSKKSLHYPIITPLIGRFNVENIALCVALCIELGIANDVIVSCAQRAIGAPGRMTRIPLQNGSTAVVDYAHTPDALEKALLTCRELIKNNADSKLICVFGCGGDRDKTKRPLMGGVSVRLSDLVIVTNDNPRNEDPNGIVADILTGVSESMVHKVKVEQNRRLAIQSAFWVSAQGDVILVAGKGHESYQIIGTERMYFDDVEEVKIYE